jgi:hypothetical protein
MQATGMVDDHLLSCFRRGDRRQAAGTQAAAASL